MTSIIYRILTRLVRTLGPRLARPGGKLAVGIDRRADAHERLGAWAGTVDGVGAASPLLWFHAPSVGEGLQAQAVMEALRAVRPDVRIVFTHFSPSAEALARRIGADVADYLPWDLPEIVGPLLDALAPAAVVFTKTEVWPELVAAAGSRGIPVALVAGTLQEGSSRARWPATWLLRDAWGGLALACAIAEPDAGRLAALGVPGGVLHVTGDPGVDSAARRAEAADPAAPYLAPFLAAPAPTIVAGSTWPADEAVLIPALAELRRERPGLRLILAPHEPTPERVRALTDTLGASGFRPAALSQVVEVGAVGEGDAVVVDSVGRLAHLYTVGQLSYVGGGFHDHGLHSVLEPAAAGVPVVIGPRTGGSRAAADLVGLGGAKIAFDTADMRRVSGAWLDDDAARDAAGGQARAYIAEHRGAAEKTADLLNILTTTRVDR